MRATHLLATDHDPEGCSGGCTCTTVSVRASCWQWSLPLRTTLTTLPADVTVVPHRMYHTQVCAWQCAFKPGCVLQPTCTNNVPSHNINHALTSTSTTYVHTPWRYARAATASHPAGACEVCATR